MKLKVTRQGGDRIYDAHWVSMVWHRGEAKMVANVKGDFNKTIILDLYDCDSFSVSNDMEVPNASDSASVY